MTSITKALLAMGLAIAVLPANAQTTREEMAADLNKTGSVYYAYPAVKADNTPAPKGYKPFHISHYGRHGSRYMIGENDYTEWSDLMHKAFEKNALTPLGVDLIHRIDTVMLEASGKAGDLSPLGRRQHKGIAARMIANYPQVFTDNANVTARSTLVPRCIISMASFCESLKEKNPALVIDMESSNRYMPYLCYGSPESDRFKNGWWKQVKKKMEGRNTRPDRLVASIFSDPDFVKKYVDTKRFMWGLYGFASDAQNTEGKVNFYDLFTADELFDLWQCFNAMFYAEHADYSPAKGVHVANARNLLRNFYDTAEAAIASDTTSAALRFGHDGNVIPLAAILGLESATAAMDNEDEFYKGWCDWKVTPMAANIQLIFYRNPKKPGDILVKFLHNEKETRIPVNTDIWPYYHWTDVKNFWDSQLGKYSNVTAPED